MFQSILDFILGLLGTLDGFIGDIFNFDEVFFDYYNQYIAPIPNTFKLVGAVFLSIIVVLGTIQFVKKMLKLFIVLAIIIVIAMALS